MEREKERISHDRIELRSEKVRNILGEVPNKLMRWGIAVTCMIFALLIAAVLLLKFPYGQGETIFDHLFLH